MNLPNTIVYNEFTLFISQFSSVQIPTASAAHLTDLIKYFISSSTFLPLTSPFQFKYTKPLLTETEQFWRTKVLYKC